jgi:Rod binding domain-containing protein
MIKTFLTPPAPPMGPVAEKMDKLRHAAQEFEAILLAHWWKEMQHSGFGDSSARNPIYSAVDSTGLEAVTQAISRDGGIGLATMMVRSLAPAVERGPGSGNGPQRADVNGVAAAAKDLKSSPSAPIGSLNSEIMP